MRPWFGFPLLAVFCSVLAAQSSGLGIITTIAGTGVAGYSGDGGPATAAMLSAPYALAVRAAGDLYFSDTGNSRIRRIAPAQTISTVTSTSARGLAFDSGGNLYGTVSTRVLRVTPEGVRTDMEVAAQHRSLGAQPLVVEGIAVDAAGNLHVADSAWSRIVTFTPAGVVLRQVEMLRSGGYSITPAGLALDGSGNLYAAGYTSHSVHKVTSGGAVAVVAGTGVEGFAGDGGPATSAQLSRPLAVAVDKAGNLYIADTNNQRIRMVTPSGTITTVAGSGTAGFSGDGGTATAARLNYPSGVAVDAEGNLYIADTGNHRIRKVTLPVSQGGPLVIATSSPLPAAAVGTAYSTTLVAGGGAPPYRWSLSAGSLPSGLSLASTTGVLSGTPTAAGTFNFTVRVTDSAQPAASATKAFTMTVEPPVTSGLSFCCLADTVAPATQQAFSLLSQPYPLAMTGQFALSFAADAAVPVDDPAVQFVPTGGRTLSFVIPANSTNVVEFPQGTGMFQTGTTAGVITVRITALTAGGVSVLPSPATSMQVRVARQPPVITSARFAPASGGFQLTVVGYSTSRELTRASFTFSQAPGTNLQTTSLSADVSSRFSELYRSAASAEHGSRFTLTVNFSVQGDVNAVAGAAVTLTNAQGDSASTPATR